MRKAAALAFEELELALYSHDSGAGRSVAALNDLPGKAALFVTWTKHGHLRGCIGTFSALQLAEGIRQYALIAAFQDSRFRPITAKELPSLEVAITLLGPLEAIADPFNWTLGEHGVKAIFPGNRTSTFLPDVAAEQGWSKEKTLEELAHKAGADSTVGIKMFRYEGHKVKLTYEEYKQEF